MQNKLNVVFLLCFVEVLNNKDLNTRLKFIVLLMIFIK